MKKAFLYGNAFFMPCAGRRACRLMAGKKVYEAIVEAVERGRLKEPFDERDFRDACRGFGEGTYYCYLYKHRAGNPGGHEEFFRLLPPARFKLIRPFRRDQFPKDRG